MVALLQACLTAAALAVGGAATTAPTAHDPQYKDKTAWPERLEAGKAAYAKETWPNAPVLVWAGNAADGAMAQIDGDGIDNARNWKQLDGQPAAKGPDSDTDVVFPAGVKVNLKAELRARHVTLAGSSSVAFANLNLAGNLWIQKGATFRFTHGTLGAADKDVFVRSDNEAGERIANFLRFNKRPDKGTEFIGRWSIGDQVFLASGQFIVGPGSTFQHTDRFPHEIYPNGSLIVLSGATYEARGNYYQKDDLVVQGKLLAGTPQRPLTADATIGLSFKALGKGKASGSGAVKASDPSDVGLLLMPKAVMAVNSADPKKARLVFRWHRNPQATFAWGAEKREGPGKGPEPADIAAMEHGISMRLFGEANLDGVVFNDVIAGGIQMPDPSVAKGWKNVTLGKGNFADSLDGLLSKWDRPAPQAKGGAAGDAGRSATAPAKPSP
jgi:hypothetical protein